MVLEKHKFNIALDLRYAENPFTGLTRFTKNLFKYLVKNENNINFLLLMPPKKNCLHLSQKFLSLFVLIRPIPEHLFLNANILPLQK